MKRNLLVITQKVDKNDDLLGFFVGWLREFSTNFDKVFVITLLEGEHDLPANVFVRSLGKEKGTPRLFRLLRFYFHLFRLVPRSDGVFAHMSPIFVIASWPLAFLFRKKIILWYSHRSLTLRLRLATALAHKVLTASDSSFLLETPKKIVTGHAIDTNYFRPGPSFGKHDPKESWRVVSIGRISPIKDYLTVIRAVKILKDRGIDLNLEIVGRPIYQSDKKYLRKIIKAVKELDLEREVAVSDYVPYGKIASVYQRAEILVNASPTGGLDKVVLEAMASGLVVFVANEGFKEDMEPYGKELIFKWGDSESLADKLERHVRNPKPLGLKLRESVVKRHNIKNIVNLIDRILQ